MAQLAVVNTLITLVEAIIALAIGFGLAWTPEQVGLVMGVVIAVGNLIKTFWARGQVTPVADPRNNEGQRLVPQTNSTNS